jgi:hypothetical protein
VRQRTSGVLTLGVAVAAAALSVAAACGPAPRDPAVAVPPPSDAGQPRVTGSSTPAAPPVDAGPADATAAAAFPNLCGCSLCEPVLSDDPCGADSDCAPASPCHAERCVAAAKAPPHDPNIMCTRIMKCGTIDANACQCVRGRCALAPHPKR